MSYSKPTFSKTSITGVIREGESVKSILASALCDWANIDAGNDPPENFGKGMAQVGIYLNISPTRDNLLKLAEKYKKA